MASLPRWPGEPVEWVTGGAQADFGVVPDLCTIGKSLGAIAGGSARRGGNP